MIFIEFVMHEHFILSLSLPSISSPLVTIGQCIGAFALAYPKPFLHDKQFGFNMASLLDQLHNCITEDATCGNVLFVVDIVIPVLTRYIIIMYMHLAVLMIIMYSTHCYGDWQN